MAWDAVRLDANMADTVTVGKRGMTPLQRSYIGASITSSVSGTMMYAVVTVLAVLVLFLAVLCGVRWLHVTGYEPRNLVGVSMQPTYYEGDAIIVDTSAEFDELVPGDIIVFDSPDGVSVCHRVHCTELDGEGFVETKGDHNQVPDPYRIDRGMYTGKVILHIPHGAFLVTADAKAIAVFALLADMILLLTYIAWKTSSDACKQMQPLYDEHMLYANATTREWR